MDFTFKDSFSNKVYLVTLEQDLLNLLEDDLITEETVVFDNINLEYVPLSKLECSKSILEKFKSIVKSTNAIKDEITNSIGYESSNNIEDKTPNTIVDENPSTVEDNTPNTIEEENSSTVEDNTPNTVEEEIANNSNNNNNRLFSFVFSSVLIIFSLIILSLNYICHYSMINFAAVESSLDEFSLTIPIFITFFIGIIFLFSILKLKCLSKKANILILFSLLFLFFNISYLGSSFYSFTQLDMQINESQLQLEEIVNFRVANDTNNIMEFSKKVFPKEKYGDFNIILESLHQNTLFKVKYTDKFNTLISKITNTSVDKFVSKEAYSSEIINTFSETKILQKHLLINYKSFYDDLEKYSNELSSAKYSNIFNIGYNDSHISTKQVYEQFVNNERLLINSLIDKYEYMHTNNLSIKN